MDYRAFEDWYDHEGWLLFGGGGTRPGRRDPSYGTKQAKLAKAIFEAGYTAGQDKLKRDIYRAIVPLIGNPPQVDR